MSIRPSSRRAWAFGTLAFLFLLACLPTARPAEAVLAGRVTRVIDGDTLDVLLASGRIRVRLHGIDAPERNQPGGSESRQWLQQRVLDQQVLLEPVSQDRYERMVAVVYLGDEILNRELLRAGQAWAYRSYLRAADRIFCDIEAAARLERRGVWAGVAVHAPWEFRRTEGQGPFTDYSRQSARDCWRHRRKS
ncbi:MAG TPA: thermonuclease family protein [Steroidobacteraceae bacterium]|nr:thermonuclease family protein [Steroidobacteraceae bacterium]